MAKAFVRRDGKFYSVDNPRRPLSRKDVERMSFHMFEDRDQGFVPSSNLLKNVYVRAIHDMHSLRDQAIPVWLGSQRCDAGNTEKLVWDGGAVAINTWSKPTYRRFGKYFANMGLFGDFLEIFFSREQDREFFLNWLAWCLQNESEKPGWAPFFYSEGKGTGKSTLCQIVSRLFGENNTAIQNNVDKLTSRFNMTVLNSKLVISEELKLDAKDKTKGNALKTYITEEWTVSEIKGQEAERVQQSACFLFTTNHLPMWIEAEDRRYWVVDVNHDGHASGPMAAEFAELCGNLKANVKLDAFAWQLYSAMMEKEIPQDFDAKTLNIAKQSTPIMKVIQSSSTRVTLEMLQEALDELGLNAIPQTKLVELATQRLRQSPEAAKHLMSELKWQKVKVKWGAIDYARSLWVRSRYHAGDGIIVGPDDEPVRLTKYLEQIDVTLFERP
jgi:hypothetical protein